MSSNSLTHNLALSQDSDAFSADPSPKYTPQFSASTQMILDRIQSGNSSPFSSMSISAATPPPPGYEDMRRSVLQTMRTSINMNMPSTPVGGRRTNNKTYKSASPIESGLAQTVTSTRSSGKGRTKTKNRNKSSIRRKRLRNESEESEEESDWNMSKPGGDSDVDDLEVIKLPKITQSGRQIVKPAQFVPSISENSSKRRASARKVAEQALCKRCGRGYSPQTNMIVFCNGCNFPWHQKCHDPIISDAAVQVESSPWHCAGCSRKKGIQTGYETAPQGVSWAGRSLEDRKAYLDSLSHAELVSLLLQATYLHPDIPLFPLPSLFKTSESYFHQPLSFSSSATSSNDLFYHSEANPMTTVNSSRKLCSPTPHGNIPFMDTFQVNPSLTKERLGEVSRESTPASPPYPRAGHGLMAKLGPDEDDLEWLVDSDDFGAFSHAVYEDFDEQNSSLREIHTIATIIENTSETHRVGVNGMSVEV